MEGATCCDLRACQDQDQTCRSKQGRSVTTATATTAAKVTTATAAATTAARTIGTTATATAAISTATATAAATTGAIFAGTRFVDRQRTPIQLHAVQGFDSFVSFFGVIHRDKGKAFGASGEFIRDELHAIHGAMGTEGIIQTGFVRIVGQIADIDFHTVFFYFCRCLLITIWSAEKLDCRPLGL